MLDETSSKTVRKDVGMCVRVFLLFFSLRLQREHAGRDSRVAGAIACLFLCGYVYRFLLILSLLNHCAEALLLESRSVRKQMSSYRAILCTLKYVHYAFAHADRDVRIYL